MFARDRTSRALARAIGVAQYAAPSGLWLTLATPNMQIVELVEAHT